MMDNPLSFSMAVVCDLPEVCRWYADLEYTHLSSAFVSNHSKALHLVLLFLTCASLHLGLDSLFLDDGDGGGLIALSLTVA